MKPFLKLAEISVGPSLMHLIELSKAKLVNCRFQGMKYFDQTCTSILSKCVKMYYSISSVLKSTIPYIHVI